MVYGKGRVQVRSNRPRRRPFVATVIVERPKRKTADIPIIVDTKQDRDELFAELEKDALSTNWDYESNREMLQSRDHALVSILALTDLRTQEALALQRKQFKILKDGIRLISVDTLKHGQTRMNITLPKKGALSPLAFIFENWLSQVPDADSYVFPSLVFAKMNNVFYATCVFYLILLLPYDAKFLVGENDPATFLKVEKLKKTTDVRLSSK